MPLTTFLHDGELNRPSGDTEIDELLAEVRRLSGFNYQVVVRKGFERFGLFGYRRRRVEVTQLFVFVGGVAPWQVLTCAYNVQTIRAFLFGLINGLNEAERRESPAVELRRRAMRAHEACYQAMLAHPEIAELQDDGALHDAIHDILRVDGGYFADSTAVARKQ